MNADGDRTGKIAGRLPCIIDPSKSRLVAAGRDVQGALEDFTVNDGRSNTSLKANARNFTAGG